MPQIFILRVRPGWDGNEPNKFEILLQRRSFSVHEQYTWGLPGGRFESDERAACNNAKSAGDLDLSCRIARRAALREVIEESADGSAPNAARHVIRLDAVPASNPPLAAMHYAKVLLPHGLRHFFEVDPSWSVQVGGSDFVYLLHPTKDMCYLTDWRPRAMPKYRVEIDEAHQSSTLPTLHNGYIWVSFESFIQGATENGRPVRGSSVGCPSWLHKWGDQVNGDRLRMAAETLYQRHYAMPPPPLQDLATYLGK